MKVGQDIEQCEEIKSNESEKPQIPNTVNIYLIFR
jgi:hypothetical protein